MELGMRCRRAMGTPGAVCPWTEEAIAAVKELLVGEGLLSVYLGQDVDAENITLLGTSRDVLELPASEPAFSFVRLSDGRLAYVYSCPETAPVRAKMFASSSTRGVTYRAEHELGVRTEKQVRRHDRVTSDARSCRRTSRRR